MDNCKRIIVIGAGASGLSAIKSCKEEFLDVICYEKSKNYGGRWKYSENTDVASVMKTTVCRTSKEIGAFSDFPPPVNFPNYMHHTKMMHYLTLYAQKFDLLRHIKYGRKVIRLTPFSEYEENGKWLVTYLNTFNKSEVTETFDGVMICTGRLAAAYIPDFPNKNLFEGITLHSKSVKNATKFENYKVLIIGNGNSAVDAAVDISTVAHQVYLSTKSGFWIYPKLGPKGLPFDTFFLRRDVHLLKTICSPLVNHCLEKYLETKTDHGMNGIKPSHRAMDKCPTINNDLPDKILTGSIIIKGNISRFEKDGVIFEHEDCVTELDAIIFATGYKMELPFMDQEIYRDLKGFLNIYKRVFPVGLTHPTLALIGFVESIGPDIPVYESQCRWATRLFAQKIQLPPKKVIHSYMNISHSKMKENSHELMEDYIRYMDELADEYGVRPDMSSLLFKDPKLFWACFTGPFLPYQYRLTGPHCLTDARNFIIDHSQRIKEPLQTRNSGESHQEITGRKHEE